MAMYDFDHWNLLRPGQVVAQQCWNGHVWFRSLKQWLIIIIRQVFKLEWPCMISITETCDQSIINRSFELEWPCMISITETGDQGYPNKIGGWNGHVWFRSLKRKALLSCSKSWSLEWPCMISITETTSGLMRATSPMRWNGHVWFRSLKQWWSVTKNRWYSWNGHVWFRSLKLTNEFFTHCPFPFLLEWPCMISITET